MKLVGLQPERVWYYFEEICGVPHPSKKEAKIRAYLKTTGEKFGIETVESEIGNIIYRKPATKGLENLKIVTLQAHMDMVPSKASTSTHNFETDPIKLVVEGDLIKAHDTTLGADNGIGVAMILALMESSDIAHGPLEALITVDEETGMTGVFGLKTGELTGEILINLDSEDDNVVCIGCAGGIDTNVSIPTTQIAVASGSVAFHLVIKGLFSGHSGCDIHMGRINAIKETANALYEMQKRFDIKLVNIVGGTLRNVIPAKCDAQFVVEGKYASEVESFVKKYESNLKTEYGSVEKKVTFTVEKIETPTHYIAESSKIIRAIEASFFGVHKMDWNVNIPETSSNFGAIKTMSSSVECIFLTRSPMAHAKEKVANMIAATYELIGAKVEHTGAYPGWLPNVNSSILKIVKEEYLKLYGEEIHVAATHGGLECGLIQGIYPNMEAVSIGANIRYPHSINEEVSISSVEKSWNFLKYILAHIETK
ncbi:MAG: aminoacyl-histidine dipeptidase [Fusobacteria bacterium]|nr:aminoacyl-histidine dipeptidase [Fusobacteriota bacterium]